MPERLTPTVASTHVLYFKSGSKFSCSVRFNSNSNLSSIFKFNSTFLWQLAYTLAHGQIGQGELIQNITK